MSYSTYGGGTVTVASGTPSPDLVNAARHHLIVPDTDTCHVDGNTLHLEFNAGTRARIGEGCAALVREHLDEIESLSLTLTGEEDEETTYSYRRGEKAVVLRSEDTADEMFPVV